jgi:hypothetical protein
MQVNPSTVSSVKTFESGLVKALFAFGFYFYATIVCDSYL